MVRYSLFIYFCFCCCLVFILLSVLSASCGLMSDINLSKISVVIVSNSSSVFFLSSGILIMQILCILQLSHISILFSSLDSLCFSVLEVIIIKKNP